MQQKILGTFIITLFLAETFFIYPNVDFSEIQDSKDSVIIENESYSDNVNKLLSNKRKEILSIAKKHGAYNVRIFGSVARNQAQSCSDVDILVDMEEDRSMLDLGGLLMDLRDLLGCNVDVVTENGLRPRIRDKVLREAVSL